MIKRIADMSSYRMPRSVHGFDPSVLTRLKVAPEDPPSPAQFVALCMTSSEVMKLHFIAASYLMVLTLLAPRLHVHADDRWLGAEQERFAPLQSVGGAAPITVDDDSITLRIEGVVPRETSCPEARTWRLKVTDKRSQESRDLMVVSMLPIGKTAVWGGSPIRTFA
jgi:hypothetical protein